MRAGDVVEATDPTKRRGVVRAVRRHRGELAILVAPLEEHEGPDEVLDLWLDARWYRQVVS